MKCVKDIPRGISYRTRRKFYSKADQETGKALSRGGEGLPAGGDRTWWRWGRSMRRASGRSAGDRGGSAHQT